MNRFIFYLTGSYERKADAKLNKKASCYIVFTKIIITTSLRLLLPYRDIMKAPFLPIKAVKRLSILAVVVACFASATTIAQSTDDWNWEHPLPGFGPEISLDRGLGTVYTMVKNNSISDIDAFKILAAGGNWLKNKKAKGSMGVAGFLPFAVKCDGGYAFLTAYLARERNIRNPAMNWDFDQLEKETPSMKRLISAMDRFIADFDYPLAESLFLESIFINAYQDVAIAEQKVERYLSNPQSREAIISEVNSLLSKLTFDLAEYRSCNPESDSSRLMLAQWGAWGLTNLLDEQKKRTQANATYKLEIDIANKSYQIRPKRKEGTRYYVVEYGNLKY